MEFWRRTKALCRCEHQLVQAALTAAEQAQQAVCNRFGLALQSCTKYVAINSASCNDSVLQWGCAALAGLLVLFLLSRIFRWYTTKRGGTLVAVAAAAAADLRRSNPKQYPPAPHTWNRVAGRQLVRPLLCAVCFERIQPDGDGKTVNACAVCGEVSHEGCARHVPHDCRPIAMDADEMTHLWRPAGVSMSLQDEEQDGMVQVCHYCRQLCDPDMFSAEPIWSCAWCQAVAHVRCYQQHHPAPEKQAAARRPAARKAAEKKAAADSKAAERRSAASRQAADVKVAAKASANALMTEAADSPSSPQSQNPVENAATCKAGNEHVPASPGAIGSPVESTGSTPPPPVMNGTSSQSNSLPPLRIPKADDTASDTEGDSDVDPPAPLPRLNGLSPGIGRTPLTPQAVQSLSHPVSHPIGQQVPQSRKLGAESRVGSLGRLMTALSAMVTDIAEGPDRGAEAPVSRPPRLLSGDDVARLDRCQLGPHWRLVMAPTAFRELPGVTWSARAKSLLPSRVRSGDKAARRRTRALASTPRPGHSWWGLSKETPWQHYTIGTIPPGAKPILVFINTKSGPQIGRDLRRRFLRALNPLQVVELPREQPERALALFADLPGLRLLVVGGDGTVGWVLGCLDAIQAARAKEGDAARPWMPPPIAILPLGTGNDLARCLNWGGGMYAYQQAGVGELLGLLEQSAVTLLDRWDVRITQVPQTLREKLKQGARDSRDGGSSIRASLGGAVGITPTATTATKVMSNYMGIGIDAKVALEFHKMRDQYPEWFASQFGNKLWYTGVGAKDILGHGSLHLSRRIKVECDGEELALPPDTEGILLLNIPSYMGGVDLWASGRPTAHAGPSGDAAQSICDQRLELVGVYGSWHLGQLQVGLSRARRLCRCSRARITLSDTMPMQVDGEPWQQAGPAELEVDFRGAALMLRRINSAPLARMAASVAEALDACQAKGIIGAAQRHALTTELATRLQPIL